MSETIELWDRVEAFPLSYMDKYEVIFYRNFPWRKDEREVKKVVVDGIKWKIHGGEREYLVKLFLDLKQ